MPAVKMLWTDSSKRQFDELRQRAADTDHESEFITTHNELVVILRDLDRVIEKSDPLYNTKNPGGAVRHCLHKFISVTFYLFAENRVGWVTKYQSVPATWPERGASS
jgi:hypothetical protein